MPVLADVDGSTATLRVQGRFDFSLRTEFLERYSAIPAEGVEFVVDLSETEYIDSSALGMLLLLREHAGAEGVKIRNCSPEVRQALATLNFDRLFDVE